MEIRDLETAQHEAAHVVVGVRLGLRLRVAGLGPWKKDGKRPADSTALGFVDFFERRGDLTAQAIMLAAGISWDRGLRYDSWHSSYDWQECMKIVHGRQSVEACITSAAAMLSGLMREHARVTRALLDQDLSHSDVADLWAIAPRNKSSRLVK